MNGFITESVSKLYDGFGTTLYLLGLVFSTRLLNAFVGKIFGYQVKFIFVLLLLAISVYALGKGFSKDHDKNKDAAYGITAGVFLWQGLQFISFVDTKELFSITALIIWGVVLLAILLGWKKIRPAAIRFFALVFILMWGGYLYLMGTNLAVNWHLAWGIIFFGLRMASLAATLVITWWIIFKSASSHNRKLAAIMLAFCAMLAGLWF